MKVTGSDIDRAALLLKDGKLVAFPTETVYGLGGNALSDSAVAAIYAAKGRPQFNPLIVHVHSLHDAQAHVTFNDKARALARRFWPGPLTLVLPRRKDCKLSLLVSAGLDSVAIRSPHHEVAQSLLAAAGIPIAAPSANRSGRISPTEAADVQEELGERVAMVLDGGQCPVGIESTVVDMVFATPAILRPGSVTREQLEAIIGTVSVQTSGDIRAPGMLASHYAPTKPLRLGAHDVRPGEALLAFGPLLPPGAAIVENLSPGRNLEEAAANLFRMLRRLDASKAQAIAAMPIPNEGLGIAINDRLSRAATR
jgi:L-threonylcarbamoyladenylate synthase